MRDPPIWAWWNTSTLITPANIRSLHGFISRSSKWSHDNHIVEISWDVKSSWSVGGSIAFSVWLSLPSYLTFPSQTFCMEPSVFCLHRQSLHPSLIVCSRRSSVIGLLVFAAKMHPFFYPIFNFISKALRRLCISRKNYVTKCSCGYWKRVLKELHACVMWPQRAEQNHFLLLLKQTTFYSHDSLLCYFVVLV